MLDPNIFFWIAASVANAVVANPNGNKILLIRCVSTLFINGKPAFINGLRKLRNPSSWVLTFLMVFFNKTPLFSKDLIAFLISFISLFVSISPEPFEENYVLHVKEVFGTSSFDLQRPKFAEPSAPNFQIVFPIVTSGPTEVLVSVPC